MLDKEKPSRFNMTYPSRGKVFSAPIRRGNFEDLKMYVGIAFNSRDLEAVKHICATDGSGIFVWPTHVLTYLQQTTWNGLDLQPKQLNMVAYLVELFYDLCISRLDVGQSRTRINVSDSPGFEKFLRDFKKE